MININELKQLVEYIANKHQTGASMSPQEYNTAVQSALDDMLLYYYGLPQRYAPGMPLPAVAWEVTQLVTDYLKGLKENPILNVDLLGRMTIPADYLHKSSITYGLTTQTTSQACDEGDQKMICADDEVTLQNLTYEQLNSSSFSTLYVPVKVVTDEIYNSLIAHSIKYPTRRYPIAKFMDDYVQYAPADLGTVKFSYLRYPLTPVWAFTNPSGFNPVYDPINSVNIELPPIVKNHVAYCVLTKLGINIREPQLQQYAETMKKDGI